MEKNITSPDNTNSETKNIIHSNVKIILLYNFELIGKKKNTTNGKIYIEMLEKSNLKPFIKLKSILSVGRVEK
ncbi:MAG: hypothetical protein IKO48_00810 [Elusimicrobia bacterium]|nr:hypothetical protein [Elusimicrobiota bacterium]